MKFALIFSLITICSIHTSGDGLSPQEIQKYKSQTEFCFLGEVIEVKTIDGDRLEGVGELRVAEVEVKSVQRGALEISAIIDVYFHYRKGQRPPSPEVRKGDIINFFIDYKIVDNAQRLYVSDSWLAQKPLKNISDSNTEDDAGLECARQVTTEIFPVASGTVEAAKELIEVAPVVKPSEEATEKFAKWWLWLVGAVIIVGGILMIRRKK